MRTDRSRSIANSRFCRFTMSVPRDLAKQLDQMTSEKGYTNRCLAGFAALPFTT